MYRKLWKVAQIAGIYSVFFGFQKGAQWYWKGKSAQFAKNALMIGTANAADAAFLSVKQDVVDGAMLPFYSIQQAYRRATQPSSVSDRRGYFYNPQILARKQYEQYKLFNFIHPFQTSVTPTQLQWGFYIDRPLLKWYVQKQFEYQQKYIRYQTAHQKIVQNFAQQGYNPQYIREQIQSIQLNDVQMWLVGRMQQHLRTQVTQYDKLAAKAPRITSWQRLKKYLKMDQNQTFDTLEFRLKKIGKLLQKTKSQVLGQLMDQMEQQLSKFQLPIQDVQEFKELVERYKVPGDETKLNPSTRLRGWQFIHKDNRPGWMGLRLLNKVFKSSNANDPSIAKVDIKPIMQKIIGQYKQSQQKYQEQTQTVQMSIMGIILMLWQLAKRKKLIDITDLPSIFYRMMRLLYRQFAQNVPKQDRRIQLANIVYSTTMIFGASQQQALAQAKAVMAAPQQSLANQAQFIQYVKIQTKHTFQELQKRAKMNPSIDFQQKNRVMQKLFSSFLDRFYFLSAQNKALLKAQAQATLQGLQSRRQKTFRQQYTRLGFHQKIKAFFKDQPYQQALVDQAFYRYKQRIQQQKQAVEQKKQTWGNFQKRQVNPFTKKNRFQLQGQLTNNQQRLLNNQFRRMAQPTKQSKKPTIAQKIDTFNDPQQVRARVNMAKLNANKTVLVRTQARRQAKRQQAKRKVQQQKQKIAHQARGYFMKGLVRTARWFTNTNKIGQTRTQQLQLLLNQKGFEPHIFKQLINKKFSAIEVQLMQHMKIVSQQLMQRMRQVGKTAAVFSKTAIVSPDAPAWLNYANLQTQKIVNQNTLSKQVQDLFNYILLHIFVNVFLNSRNNAQVLLYCQAVSTTYPMMSMVQSYQYAAMQFASQRSYSQIIMNTQLILGQPLTLYLRPSNLYVWNQIFVDLSAKQSPYIMQLPGQLKLSIQFQIDFAARLVLGAHLLVLGKRYKYDLDDTAVIWQISQLVVKTKYSFTQQIYKSSGRT